MEGVGRKGMRIPVLTFNYDRYWKEFVVGFGLIRIGGCKCARGLSFWKRLVGFRLRRRIVEVDSP